MYVRTWMLAQAVFPSKHQAQVSLKKLYDKRLVGRFRTDSREDYIYHIPGKVSNKWLHWDAINLFHFRFIHEVIHYEFEYKYAHGQADGFYVVKTDQGVIKFFLEVDTVTSHRFDKIKNYNKAYQGYWMKEFYADPLESGITSFPIILIVTPRLDVIKKTVLSDNVHQLKIKLFNSNSKEFQFASNQ